MTCCDRPSQRRSSTTGRATKHRCARCPPSCDTVVGSSWKRPRGLSPWGIGCLLGTGGQYHVHIISCLKKLHRCVCIVFIYIYISLCVCVYVCIYLIMYKHTLGIPIFWNLGGSKWTQTIFFLWAERWLLDSFRWAFATPTWVVQTTRSFACTFAADVFNGGGHWKSPMSQQARQDSR